WDLRQASSLQLRRHFRFSDHDPDATPDETRRLARVLEALGDVLPIAARAVDAGMLDTEA
ncbi:hypothetical protein, partial [Streptomyces sp. NPDC058451]|uniref:hypothetical protein n=1 Tax=Streptomyces sp. NPDC058451 TaxID=3346506 RepID=UPI003667BCAD